MPHRCQQSKTKNSTLWNVNAPMSFNLVMFIRTVHSKQNHSSIGPRVLHLHSTVIMQHYKYIFFFKGKGCIYKPANDLDAWKSSWPLLSCALSPVWFLCQCALLCIQMYRKDILHLGKSEGAKTSLLHHESAPKPHQRQKQKKNKKKNPHLYVEVIICFLIPNIFQFLDTNVHLQKSSTLNCLRSMSKDVSV